MIGASPTLVGSIEIFLREARFCFPSMATLKFQNVALEYKIHTSSTVYSIHFSVAFLPFGTQSMATACFLPVGEISRPM